MNDLVYKKIGPVTTAEFVRLFDEAINYAFYEVFEKDWCKEQTTCVFRARIGNKKKLANPLHWVVDQTSVEEIYGRFLSALKFTTGECLVKFLAGRSLNPPSSGQIYPSIKDTQAVKFVEVFDKSWEKAVLLINKSKWCKSPSSLKSLSGCHYDRGDPVTCQVVKANSVCTLITDWKCTLQTHARILLGEALLDRRSLV